MCLCIPFCVQKIHMMSVSLYTNRSRSPCNASGQQKCTFHGDGNAIRYVLPLPFNHLAGPLNIHILHAALIMLYICVGAWMAFPV